MTSRLHAWAHRRGVARILNTSSNSANNRCTAYVETRGPRWLGVRLARWTLARSSHARPDLDSIRAYAYERVDRHSYRWRLTYKSVGR